MSLPSIRLRHSLRALFRAKKIAASEKVRLQNSNDALWNDPLVQAAYRQMGCGRRQIETTIEDKALVRKFMDRVIGQWQVLGEEEPYWSNAPMSQLKRESLDLVALDDFYKSGTEWMETLRAFESRSGIEIKNGVCLELGAGVGRYTHALARRFARVIAVDVSAGGLRACREHVEKLKLENVTIALLSSPDDIAKFGPIDFFLSLSTLQHNPPPVQKLLLDHAFEHIPVGGYALFQTPDWLDGYAFSSKQFLETAQDAMCDCHCLPKTTVLEILRSGRMRLLDFAPDFTVEQFGSYTYFARKESECETRGRSRNEGEMGDKKT